MKASDTVVSRSSLAQRVNQVYLHEPFALVATLVNASILAYFQAPHASRPQLVFWCATLLVITAVRFFIRYAFRRRPVAPENARLWSLVFIASVGISGTAWGMAAMVFFPQDLIAFQVFTAFVIGGMVAGAAAAYSPLKGAFLAYAVPALLPLLWRFGSEGGEIYPAMAFMVLVFGILIWNISKRIQTMTWSALALRHEKQELVETLSDSVSEARALNQHLREEMDRRENADRELRKYREQLESMVANRTAELSQANRELEEVLEEKTQVEKSLRESEEKHKLVVAHAQEGIFVVQEGEVKFSNPEAQKLLTMGPGDGRQFAIEDWMDFEKGEQENPPLRYGRKGSDSVRTVALTLTSESRGEVQLEVDCVPITWEGRSAIVYFARDITQRRRLEEQLTLARKMESLGTLAGGIAHDFNNLLMGIGGQVSLMQAEVAPDHPHANRLQAVEKQVLSGAELTRQLLGLALGGRYEVQTTDLNRLVDKVVLLFGRTHKEIRVRAQLHHELWLVEADRNQIEQVLLNICLNASQAMQSRGSLTLVTRNVEIPEAQAMPLDVEAGPFVVVDIVDTGGGIDKKVLGRIFDPFFTTREFGQGAGLGLASAYGMIRNHGGFIEVKTELGEGTRFSVHLPRSLKPNAVLEGDSMGASTHRGTILLVDDEKIVADVAEQMLKKLGFQVLTAKDGFSALQLYHDRKSEIDLVLLDMIMPGMGGRETFDGLKADNPEVRVLLASGYSLDEQVQSMLRQGCAGFISKPFNLRQLGDKLREVFDRSQGQDLQNHSHP